MKNYLNMMMLAVMVRTLIKNEEEAVPKAYYTTRELAEVVGFSVSWVTKWRPKIAGARQVNRAWRFDKNIINSRLARGLSIVV